MGSGLVEWCFCIEVVVESDCEGCYLVLIVKEESVV